MKDIAYITGTSSGIGKAITEHLLETGEWQVEGFSRRNVIDHANYRHHTLDLSQPEQVQQVAFEAPEDTERILLVNNAGRVEPVKHLGEFSPGEAEKSLRLNLLAPMLLMNEFVKALQQHSARKVVINISSGAAQYPVDGWTLYCTTKAAMDMATQVAALEEEQHPHGFHFMAVAPGIVDTEMQDVIRGAEVEQFSRLKEFKAYKQQHQLKSPSKVAEELYPYIQHPERISEVILRLP